VLAFYPFEGVIRAAVLAFKYRRCTRLARFLAPALVAALQARPLSVDLVVPVPLSRARQSQRGFNQSELLARPLAAELGWPLDGTALVRQRDTLQQTRLSARERRRNVEGAFVVPEAAAVAGKRVLLVDDVCTTGATLGACANALRQAGAAAVWGVVVAREA
jgi:ComF family protein